MIETNPFGYFAPKNSKYLILGSFTAVIKSPTHDWFYGSTRNQFWKILEEVYSIKLPDKASKQVLLTKLKIAITDIIYQCERKNNNSLDANLVNIVYNFKDIAKILSRNKIEKIYFSSRFVEKEFKKNFKRFILKYPKIELITLPSPSPRYASMKTPEKIKIYKLLLPQLPKFPHQKARE